MTNPPENSPANDDEVIEHLVKKLEVTRMALELVLPMAKAYAHHFPLGSNSAYVAKAEEVLDATNPNQETDA
ncbi:hypothetical protein [Zavarzinella formosa]|uniref:hypothetical protein n=1 Tax=Zavarzinella formosa TaxID=360055 RepID=UPI0002D7B44F|nr:hypothetical protein [Zavarzinella formosa]